MTAMRDEIQLLASWARRNVLRRACLCHADESPIPDTILVWVDCDSKEMNGVVDTLMTDLLDTIDAPVGLMVRIRRHTSDPRFMNG